MKSGVEASEAWYRLDKETIRECFKLDLDAGLSDAEVDQQRSRYGRNLLPETQVRSTFSILLSQFRDFMVIMLIIAAVVSGVIGELADTITIVVIVVLNAVIGFVQELRAEKAITALKQLAAPNAFVRRNGEVFDIPAEELVPGDVLLINAGDLIAADCRLWESANLRTDESLLTGESETVGKHDQQISTPDLVLGDQKNMLFKGSQVTNGRGVAIVTGTGLDTELGRIADLMKTEGPSKTPLQDRLAVLGRQLAAIVLVICVVIFVFGLLRGEPVVLMLLTAVSLAVAAIPEALPAVVSIALAIGARKMVLQNALIRKLPAVESLGSVTYICTDKTGTLTLNQMQVKQYYTDSQWRPEMASSELSEEAKQLLLSMLLCNDATKSGEDYVGDPTETAILAAAELNGLDKQETLTQLPRVAEIPFESTRKSMSTLHQDGEQIVVYSKGSPERMLDICSQEFDGDDLRPVNRDKHIQLAHEMASQGYRVLGFATKRYPRIPDEVTPERVEKDMVFLGMLALMDPPRPEAKSAVSQCQTAGIFPVMITGDHASTARAIASQIGICGDQDIVVTGEELSRMSDDDLFRRVKAIKAYARVSPEQKTRIVDALQGHGEYVAMTGDGVNDAPSLRRANIGIAMGKKGTDVAREASDAILLDDNFATIVYAVSAGRRIYDNIRKFIKYTLTSNTGEIWTLFLAPLMGYPLPLLPIHILWINLVTDGLPGLALSFEKAEPNVMDRPPRKPGESIFARGMWQHILAIGLLIGFLSVGVQIWALENGNPHWQTLVFTVLTFSQLVHSLVIRSEYVSLFSMGIMSNMKLFLAVLLTIILQLAIIYVPILNSIFQTQPLTPIELLICFGLPLFVLIFVEIEKWLVRRKLIYISK